MERRASSIEFVYEAHPWDAIFVSLSPYGLGLRFHSRYPIKHGHGAVENAQRTFNFDCEVHVPRSVDDVDYVVVPHAGCGSRGNGYPSLLFLLHPVHGRCTIVDFTNLVVHSGVIEDPLRGSGFPSINVGHDAYISNAVKGLIAWHGVSASVFFGVRG